LTRRTDSRFNSVILKRLANTRNNRFPVSLSRIFKTLSKKDAKKQDRLNRTVVTVGTITNDARLLTIPKLTVVALRVTESARKRILAAGGQVLTFDQFALKNPTGSGAVLLRGPREREAYKHFGAHPGAKQ
jgi:large subunit ribosomal protein L18e